MPDRVQPIRPFRTLPARLEPLEHRTLLAAADLDTTFSGDGVAITDHPGLQEQYSSAALAPDGRLVLAGTANGATTGQDFVVAPLLPDGTRDSSFNRGAGSVQTDTNNEHNRVDGLLVQPDGKIVVVGATYTRSIIDGTQSQFLVIRYRTDGTLDTSFGNGGRVFLKDFVPGDEAYPSDIIIQPDGKLVISGSGRISDYLVARLLPNGQPDPTFGGGDGKFVTKPQGVTTLADAEDLALAPDGKIIVVGHVGLPDAGGFGILKLNADGTLDTTFGGGDGKVTTTFTEDTSAGGYTVGVYGDGKFVVGGYVGGFDKFALARYNPDGTLDTTFSSDGRVVTDLPGSGAFVRGVQILADGDVLAVGSTGLGENAKGVAVVRYNHNGSLDTAFSGDGILTTKYGLTQVRPDDMAVRPDGRFIVAALSYMEEDPYDYRFVTAQYQGGAAPNGAWIAGTIYDDRNKDNQYWTGDVPIAGARVFIDADNDDIYDPGEKSVFTNADGNYAFTFMQPGNYHWGVVPPAGYEPYLSTGFYSLPLAAGQQLSAKDIALVPNQPQFTNGTPGDDTFLVRLDSTQEYFEIYNGPTATGAPSYRVHLSSSNFEHFLFVLLGGNDTVIIDASNGDPIPSSPLGEPQGIDIEGGDGFDTLRVIGRPGLDHFRHNTTQSGFYPGGGFIDHTSIERTEFDGNTGLEDVTVVGGTLNLHNPQDLATIHVMSGANLVVPASGSNMIRATDLTIEPNARFDLNDNDLILRVTPQNRAGMIEKVHAAIALGRLFSSAAAARPATGLATGIRPLVSPDSELVVKYTYNGDANLDGRINADDYFKIDQGFLAQSTTPTYSQGDFNYDGRINADDYFLIDQAFLGQGAPLAGSGDSSPLASTAVPQRTRSETMESALPRRKTRRVRPAPSFERTAPPPV